MTVYFLTRQPDVCQLIADRLQESDVEIKIYPVITNLLQTVFDFNLEPDILFLDYMYYQNENFDPYLLLKKYNKIFPIVFYNHPYPLPDKRRLFWLYSLKRTGLFNNLSRIEPILYSMEEALKDPRIFPYVSGIQQPKPYKSSNLRYIVPLNENEIEYYKQHYSNVITDYYSDGFNFIQNEHIYVSDIIPEYVKQFRSKNRLSHKLTVLLSYLYLKRNSHVPMTELCSVLSENGKAISPNSLRLCIHRLRNHLKRNRDTSVDLISFDHGYMLIDKEEGNVLSRNRAAT
ncbi:MAG: hypothetical protein IK002_04365 [Treponema sp.]|uniref:hypothetical protein n=1 Tax=Treponema sp. TaxID=166 RepID=UPI00298DE0DE|nr:hypothetical protein [Treponema sp.]MBR5933203.1 hypothetical protein [Treponema sp.]